MISVEHLSKTFQPDNIQAVKDISFGLSEGEIGCLIGTSGCGKTTTLKMINRLIEPSSGEIRVQNRLAHSMPAYEWRRKIGYVIQKAGLLPHLTIFDNISILSRILKRDEQLIKDRVRELLNIVNLPVEKFGKRYPHELSGGQQQRVGIARALMENPQVILMDEPFGALDPITRLELHNEFIQLNRNLKKTILMVTHDLDEAFKLGDKIFLMQSGEIIQAGTKQDFIDNPKSKFVAEFVKGLSS